MRTDTNADKPVVTYDKAHRRAFKNGDVLLYRGKGIVSWLIRIVTRSPYSHVGVAAWWNSRLMVLEAVGKGVVASPLSENLRRYDGRVDYYWCATDIADDKRLQMVDFAQMQLGKHYNYWNVFMSGVRVLFGLNLKDKQGKFKHAAGTYFCSQYVSDIFHQAGVDLGVDQASDRVTPDALAKSPQLIFQGVLKREAK